MAENAPQFEIPPQALAELGEVADFSARLADVRQAIGRVGVSSTFDQTKSAVASALEIDATRATRLIRGLGNLRVILHQTRLPVQDVLDAFTSSLVQTAPQDWIRNHLEKWNANGPAIAEFISRKNDDALLTQNKIRELTYLRENILKSSRLLTELRPIYDAAVESILTTVLTTSLVIKYHADGEEREIFFEMDVDDISELRAQCDRAERKIAATKRAFSGVAWSLSIAGQRDREDVK